MASEADKGGAKGRSKAKRAGSEGQGSGAPKPASRRTSSAAPKAAPAKRQFADDTGVPHPAVTTGALGSAERVGPDLSDETVVAELSARFMRMFDAQGGLQVATFLLGDEEYGLPVSQVQEILRLSSAKVVEIPNAPRFCLGVINLRGRLVPVLDIVRRFGLVSGEATRASRMMILSVGRHTFGAVVDGVVEVAKIIATDIRPLPELAVGLDSSYVVGVVHLNERIVAVLDLELLFSEDEQHLMTSFARTSEGPAQPG